MEFSCADGRQCIHRDKYCNNHFDCLDRSDEKVCQQQPDDNYLNLRVYPTEQRIQKGRQVVFQCRDESPNRARVKWFRGNGLQFPPGTIDYNGRLEMPRIQV